MFPSSTPVVAPPRLSAKAPAADVKAAREAPPNTVVPAAFSGPVGAVALPTPMSEPAVPVTPLIVALVTAALARTPYVEAVPIESADSAAVADLGKNPIVKATTVLTTAIVFSAELCLRMVLISFLSFV